ncbi:MAG: spore coat associated protein CotJA [Ruminococcus sp.]|nr:spore coat associated protein CotJA [Ruminococcus sp.]
MNFSIFDNADGILMNDRKNKPSDSGMSRFPKKTPLAMAYVPFQEWGDVYDEDSAFERGTLFPVLDFPFERGERR